MKLPFKFTSLVVWLITCCFLFFNNAAAADPEVKIIMYWEAGCPACERVLKDILPGLQSQYGDQLRTELVEVSSVEDVNRLYQLGNAYGLAKAEIGMPFLIIDERVLVGSNDIAAKLPGLIEEYLAAGGVDTQARAIQPSPLSNVKQESSSALEAQPIWNGMALAWILMAFMLLALVITVWVVLQAFRGKDLPGAPAWLTSSIPILAVLGLGVAAYLTFVEATYTPVVCGPVGDCNAVQTSSYARLFGVIPVGLMGAVGYLGILGVSLYSRFRHDQISANGPIVILGMAGFGTLFSIYLTYLEIFVIHAVCIWCISSALLITLILLAGLPSAAAWLKLEDEEES